MWRPCDNGSVIGKQVTNSEWTTVKDEEYMGSVHITLEKGSGRIPYSITCGMHGFFVHTVYAGEDEAFQLYEEMKADLEDVYAAYSEMTDYETQYDSGRIEEFVDKYL